MYKIINNTHYTDKEFLILNEVTEFCKNDCGNKECCLEEKCVLFRIEKIMVNGGKIE